MGGFTKATAQASTAMGYGTTASGKHSTAMGHAIEASADDALVNSGTIHGNGISFFADERLVSDIDAADPTSLLRNIQSLKVMSHIPSANYCRHQNRSTADCAGDRTVGLLAQHVVTVVPKAVSSVSSLKLTDGTGHRTHTDRNVLEHVVSLQSLDVHVLLAQLVGAVQALSEQINTQSQQIQVLSEQNRVQSEQIQMQTKQHWI
jgi:hypothetical protein